MTPAQLRESAKAQDAPPAKLTPAAEALWWIARGDWEPTEPAGGKKGKGKGKKKSGG